MANDQYKNVRVICGFSGVGKSTAEQRHNKVIDFESSGYSHIFEPGEFDRRNPAFPRNYIDAVCEHIENAANNVYLLSCHESVRMELKNRGIPYIIVMPHRDLKEEYIRRWFRRGSPTTFIEYMCDVWDDMIDSCERDDSPKIHLEADEYLDDILCP